MSFAFSNVRRRVVPMVAGSAVMLMALTGCQGSDDPSATETPDAPSQSASASPSASATPTAPSTPEPSPASSLGPAANIPVPVKPALADENTAEGLEAFTEYWFELLSYGYATNDWAELDRLTDPGCRTCASIKAAVVELYGQGRWVRGADVAVVSFDTTFEKTTSGAVQAYVENQQSEIIYFETDGTILRIVPEQDPPAFDVVNALYQDDEWILLDYGAVEGTK